MEEIHITAEELDHYSNPTSINTVSEPPASLKPQMSFEEAAKACCGITLDEFSKIWDEIIENDPRLM